MSNKIYTSVPVPNFPRNIFSLSRPVVGSCRFQRCYPTEILEIFPGDAFNVRQETFLRTSPLVAPPLAKVTLSHHAFFVPSWQLHKEFDNFITGGEKMDFTDHLPFTYVQDLVQWIVFMLAVPVVTLSDQTETHDCLGALLDLPSSSYSPLKHDWMEDVVSLIELLDFSRAIPLTMPEFQPLQAVDSQGVLRGFEDISSSDYSDESSWISALLEIAQSNLDAFRDLNPGLSSLLLRVNLVPLYAYLKAWCEYFRDENLVEDYWDTLKESDFFTQTDYIQLYPDVTSYLEPTDTDLNYTVFDAWSQIVKFFALKRRPWRKDRFTSALPWTQKGPDVAIPLSGTLPVSLGSTNPTPATNQALYGTSDGIKFTNGQKASVVGNANLGDAIGLSTMRDLRRAEAVEEFEEADGRFGNRYPENTLGQFGVYTPDSRLPRCQFLGFSQQVITFGEIAQTSETNDTPLGTLAGKGTSYQPAYLFKKRFTMHGYVVVFTSLQVSAMYEQGIHPMFSRYDRTEYLWPRYARLGEEPIYTKELSVFGDHINEGQVFGYAPRYSSFKSDTGSIHGQMKSTLSYWTFSRKFKLGDDPKLSEDFIYNDPRKDAFAVSNPYAENFYFEIDWKVRASRLLPFYGVPSI